MRLDHREPAYTIGVVARKLKVCPATIRIWEKKKLIKPARMGKDRLFSQHDLERLAKIKGLLQEKRINIEGVKKILETKRCWEVKRCAPRVRDACRVYLETGGD